MNSDGAARSARPTPPRPVDPRVIPALAFLTAPEHARWVGWRYDWVAGKRGKPGKWTKTPRRLSGRLANSGDPSTWARFTEIWQRLEAGDFDGIGLMLFGLPARRLAAIDLDRVRDPITGSLAPWAAAVIAAAGSYTEITPSDHGSRVLGVAPGIDAVHRRKDPHPSGIGGFELFANTPRFITLSGRLLNGHGALADITPVIRDLLAVADAKPHRQSNGADPGHTDGAGADPDGEPPIDLETLSPIIVELIVRGTLDGKPVTRRGPAFLRVSRYLRNKGHGIDAVLALLAAHPGGVAGKYGARLEAELRRAWNKIDTAAGDPDLPLRFSENALAHLFTAEHGHGVLYVHEWGAWLAWKGGRWQQDHAVTVFDAARAICAREGNIARASIPNGGQRIAVAINKASAIAAIERLARHHAPHVRPAEAFDADPLLLNTPLDSVDLRDAITPGRPHRMEDYATRATTVAAAETAACPTWIGFLHRIMADDPDMVAYLQRVSGYMLTGSVKEHVVFFGHGGGANGKSTFANALLGILGTGPAGYAAVAPISTFTASSTEQHPTDLAMLRGVRCVIAQETEEGRSWAVSKLKMMTGGDMIAARFMRQDFFTYAPQFKIMILGNHKPMLRGVDEATRRRFHLIPFGVTVPPAERDPKLGEKLKAEYPQILRWMIDGCVAWQHGGLKPPKKVIEATKAYLIDEDSLAAWLRECCWVGRQHYDTLINLFASWKSWAEANGERVGQRKEFAKALDARPGFSRREQAGTGRGGWEGLAVMSASPGWQGEN